MKCIVQLLRREACKLLYDKFETSLPDGQEGKESIAPGNGNDFPECSIVRFHALYLDNVMFPIKKHVNQQYIHNRTAALCSVWTA